MPTATLENEIMDLDAIFDTVVEKEERNVNIFDLIISQQVKSE